MIVRDASREDLPAIADIAQVADPPDEGDDVDLRYYAHLLAHGHLVVAEISGIVIGYAGSVLAGPLRHVTDVFLHPDVRGKGIGTQLLAALMPDGHPTATFSSQHPAALPLYVRRGLVPRWPLFYLRGSAADLPGSELQVVPTDASRAARLEATWLGWDRSVEYAHWAGVPENRVFAVLQAGAPVAVGALGRRRHRDTLLHLASSDESVICEAVLAALATCGNDVLVPVPGESAVLRPLLEARWRILDQDLLCASECALVESRRLIPHPGLL